MWLSAQINEPAPSSALSTLRILCRIRAYMAERQAREDAEAAKKAAKKESADRIYERLKGEQEAAQARRDEEDRLINLLQAEEEAERARL